MIANIILGMGFVLVSLAGAIGGFIENSAKANSSTKEEQVELNVRMERNRIKC